MRRNFLLTPFLSHPLPVHLEFNTLLEYCFLEHSRMVFFCFFVYMPTIGVLPLTGFDN